jgi:hypothetical protein
MGQRKGIGGLFFGRGRFLGRSVLRSRRATLRDQGR